MTTEQRVRRVVAEHAGITSPVERLAPGDDLFAAGMTSHTSVNVMLGLEEEFGVEFPDELLNRSVFGSIRSMAEAVDRLGDTDGS